MLSLEGHLAGISTIAWSPDSKSLASGSDDKSIRLWDVSTVSSAPFPYLLGNVMLTPQETGKTLSRPSPRPPQLHLLHRLFPQRQHARLRLLRRGRLPLGRPHRPRHALSPCALRSGRRRRLYPRWHPDRQLCGRRTHVHLPPP